MKSRLIACLLLIFMLTPVISFTEEANDITLKCRLKSDLSPREKSHMTDRNYSTYWLSGETLNPYLVIESDEPIFGLYLCFREMPDSYVIQHKENGEWTTLIEGDTRFLHKFYELNGETELRVYSTQKNKHRLIFNEIFVFGKGDIPDWVQRWQATVDKSDILLLVAHPDDELLFFAGTIPTYDTEMGKRVIVAYLTYADKTRRSELLNGLWAMGVKHYPVLGPFKDRECKSLDEAYINASGIGVKNGKSGVLKWVAELFRKYKPEVVITHDINGEYGHGQHRMAADACIKCFDLAADPDFEPESALKYGVWPVKKLYIHMYGDEEKQLHFDWNKPLHNANGKTGMELAAEAFSKHVSQAKLYLNINGCRKPLSVDVVGGFYKNTDFGLYATRVGEDEKRNDFLEHIDVPDEQKKQ